MVGSAPFSVNGTYVGHFMENIKLYCFILCRGKKLMDAVLLFSFKRHEKDAFKVLDNLGNRP